MSYETVIEQIDVTTKDGRKATFDVCCEPGQPQRVFAHGTTLYYDIQTFNAGLGKAASFVRRQIADLFEVESSDVRGPSHAN
jgi:hypothetical protein